VSPDYDAIVAGLGAFGAAAAAALARRGARVLGLDRYGPPHAMGSSHGRTRIIREAYFEAPFYVPLVRKAYEAWTALEAERGKELLRVTGGLVVGPGEGELVRGALASVREHGLEHELLDPAGLARRFPALSVSGSEVGVLEARAGVLAAEDCVAALLDVARAAGAELRAGEALEAWEVRKGDVVVRTTERTYRSGRLVLALGPWLGRHLGAELPAGLEVERQVVHWFAPPDGSPAPGHEPATIWEYEPGRLFYTIPDVGDGVKAAIHHEGSPTDPELDPRQATADDREAARALLCRLLPGAAGRLLRSSVCLYTNTSDRNLLVGPHPREPHVVLAGGGSGHGFKFAPVVGELVAGFVLEGPPPDVPPELLPRRFEP
jgi:sarcosine oxidase